MANMRWYSREREREKASVIYEIHLHLSDVICEGELFSLSVNANTARNITLR